jgi:hypothetical protein
MCGLEGLKYLLLTKIDLTLTERGWHSIFAEILGFIGNSECKSRLLKFDGN